MLRGLRSFRGSNDQVRAKGLGCGEVLRAAAELSRLGRWSTGPSTIVLLNTLAYPPSHASSPRVGRIASKRRRGKKHGTERTKGDVERWSCTRYICYLYVANKPEIICLVARIVY